MATTFLPTTHIWLDERGIAWVDNTNTKVIEIVLDKLAYGGSPDEMHAQHPNLSLAQIDAAFAYYFDITRRWISRSAIKTPMRKRCIGKRDPPLVQRLRAEMNCD